MTQLLSVDIIISVTRSIILYVPGIPGGMPFFPEKAWRNAGTSRLMSLKVNPLLSLGFTETFSLYNSFAYFFMVVTFSFSFYILVAEPFFYM